jgi:hypothetical protein
LVIECLPSMHKALGLTPSTGNIYIYTHTYLCTYVYISIQTYVPSERIHT